MYESCPPTDQFAKLPCRQVNFSRLASMGVQEELFPGFVILPSESPSKSTNRGMFPKRTMQLAPNESPPYGHGPQAAI